MNSRDDIRPISYMKANVPKMVRLRMFLGTKRIKAPVSPNFIFALSSSK